MPSPLPRQTPNPCGPLFRAAAATRSTTPSPFRSVATNAAESPVFVVGPGRNVPFPFLGAGGLNCHRSGVSLRRSRVWVPSFGPFEFGRAGEVRNFPDMRQRQVHNPRQRNAIRQISSGRGNGQLREPGFPDLFPQRLVAVKDRLFLGLQQRLVIVDEPGRFLPIAPVPHANPDAKESGDPSLEILRDLSVGETPCG